MATKSRKTGIPEFFADTQSAENLRRQFIEAPMEAASQSALGVGIELATLMSILPDAFAASQRRELERVQESGKENDARVAALRTSIEQADVLRTMARRGQVRIQRALVAVAANDDVFHGFVSDADLAPLKGLTVRLTGGRNTRAKAFSATTDDDGYFSIALGAKSDAQRDSGAKASPINVSQRITNLMAGLSQETSASSAASAEGGVSQVEILKRGTLLHRDPVLVARDGGSIYREYVIADTEASSASDFRDFTSARSYKPPSPQGDPTAGAAATSPASTDVPHSPATPVAPPSAKKRSPRGVKFIKPRSKK